MPQIITLLLVLLCFIMTTLPHRLMGLFQVVQIHLICNSPSTKQNPLGWSNSRGYSM
ncbi:hypothetical protein GLYMA_20G036350v4 [Glycine max]|nr:hypothetical protein GLYMA_20G036350v4 [Glycine max]KAH1034391.1 hypothetical protein GYH30_054691 [Glycine max]